MSAYYIARGVQGGHLGRVLFLDVLIFFLAAMSYFFYFLFILCQCLVLRLCQYDFYYGLAVLFLIFYYSRHSFERLYGVEAFLFLLCELFLR